MKNVTMIMFREPMLDAKGDQLLTYNRREYFLKCGYHINEVYVDNSIRSVVRNLHLVLYNYFIKKQPLQCAIFNEFFEKTIKGFPGEPHILYVNNIRSLNVLKYFYKSDKKFCFELIDSMSLNVLRLCSSKNFFFRFFYKNEAKRVRLLE